MNANNLKLQVVCKIKKYRQFYKLTQFKLGELIDINQRQVAQIELGKSFPSLTTLINMSKIFNCRIADFFEDEEQINENELKLILISLIEKLDYKNCQKIYSIIKNVIDIS